MQGAGQSGRPEPDQPGPTAAEEALGHFRRRPSRWLVATYRRHAWTFLAVNVALNIANGVTGRPWWAFWPLLATTFLLGVHYLLYKGLSVDDEWAEERTQELNLKSYDRSHIEGLKSRYGGPPDQKS